MNDELLVLLNMLLLCMAATVASDSYACMDSCGSITNISFPLASTTVFPLLIHRVDKNPASLGLVIIILSNIMLPALWEKIMKRKNFIQNGGIQLQESMR